MTATRKVIAGDWMREGCIDTYAPRHLEVLIVDGRAYDAGTYALTPARYRGECLLKVDADGSIQAWGGSTSFSPDAGELEKIGLA